MRAAAFVSGGLIPTALRGTHSNVAGHIADWYSTICVLAGVPFADDSPVAPLPVDPANPTKDIYANGAFPSVDGVDMWPFWVTNPKSPSEAAHPKGLWLSAEVMVLGQYKLVVAQQDPRTTNSGPTLGWRCGGSGNPRCDTTTSYECGENPDTKGARTPQCQQQWVNASAKQCACGCSYEERDHFVPCLFDVNADKSEFTDISAQQLATRQQLWERLNASNLELYMHRGMERVENGTTRSPAHLLGPCNQECANAYWAKWGLGSAGPVCGVPGCS